MLEGQNNKKIFSERVLEYTVDYWRDDEDFLVKRYFKNKNGKFLVLGCGGGRTLSHLHNLGYKSITAIDIVPEMVQAAKDKVIDKNIKMEILEMDATDLKFQDKSFDYVFFPFHGIDYIHPDIYRCVGEARRVLKPGGIFIYNSHNLLFLKTLNRLSDGKYSDYRGLITYRSSLVDYFRLKKCFGKVKMKYRISMQKMENSNWKDNLYKIFPFLDKSVYFICHK